MTIPYALCSAVYRCKDMYRHGSIVVKSGGLSNDDVIFVWHILVEN